MKKLFAIIMSVLMVACFMPTMAFADVAAPTVSGDEITVTPENAQATLNGQYGPINGKTIVLTEGTYDALTIGGVTAETKGDITLTCNHTDGTHYSYTDAEGYKAHVAENVFHYTSTYTRTMENVTLVARGEVTVKGVLITSGHLHQEPNPFREDYTGYYLNQNLTNFTFSGINFVGNVNINTSSADTVFDGFTFDNCTFTTDGTTSDKGQAIRYYNENNNGKVKNLVVKNCEFNNCYQGVYTAKVNNISVTDCTFNTTGHNAIAVQGQNVNHGAVVITNNYFTGIGDRIIRFDTVGAGTQITISNNTATNSGDSEGEVIKANSLADGITYNVCKNNWGDGKKVGNTEFSEKTAVAQVGNVYYTSLNDAVNAAKNNDTVILCDDVSGDGVMVVAANAKTITIDFNGHTYTMNGKMVGSKGTENQAFHFEAGWNITLKNGTLKAMNCEKAIQNYANLTLKNFNVDASENTACEYAMSNNCGIVNVEGTSSVSVTEGNTAIEACYWPEKYSVGTSVNVNTTGTVIGNIEVGLYGTKGTITLPSKSILSIKNVNHTGAFVFINPQTGDYATGLTDEAALTELKDKLFITGGTFSSDPSAYVADNYVAVKSGDTWTVRAKATSSGGSYRETPLEKAKKEANTAVSAAASANKYDDAEQAEVKAILDKAAADIKNAKTEEEVKAIKEAAQAEIDKVLTTEEKAQVASVGSVDKDIFKAKSKYSKLNGKKAIKITWNVPEGMKLDGFEVFRSTKKYSGFGKTPYFTTTNTSYTNNKDLVAGKTYYYKVRGFVEINGERYYTGFSTKAFRTIK